MDVLLTWVGARDPVWRNPRTGNVEPGPILSLLGSRHFDVVYLLLNLDSRVGDFRQLATGVQRACERQFPSVRVRQIPVDLVSVTDYREVFRVTNHVCQRLLDEQGRAGHSNYVYLSPGTPQMQTVWVLLVQSGLLPARLIEATPPDLLAPGNPPWREVELELEDFPQIVAPGETTRLLGVLRAQNDNLAAENRRLRAELELLRAGAPARESASLPPDFRLPDYLTAQERALYTQAFEQAGGKAAEAARLLGIDPARFRARAATLGIRSRRRVGPKA
ncbi:MAG: hypothetical protein HY329_05380 [Chloroflexi bacterium]|nr:hypothetical protein [Chloroflexota bacterium]